PQPDEALTREVDDGVVPLDPRGVHFPPRRVPVHGAGLARVPPAPHQPRHLVPVRAQPRDQGGTDQPARPRDRDAHSPPFRHPSLLTRRPLEAHTETRSFISRGAAESAESLPGRAAFFVEPSLLRPNPRSGLNVVSSGGIPAHPAGEGAGRGRLHPANADPPGANNHISGSRSTPRSLRSAREPEPTLCALRTSAFSASPREPITPRLCVSERGAGAAEAAEDRRGQR